MHTTIFQWAESRSFSHGPKLFQVSAYIKLPEEVWLQDTTSGSQLSFSLGW